VSGFRFKIALDLVSAGREEDALVIALRYLRERGGPLGYRKTPRDGMAFRAPERRALPATKFLVWGTALDIHVREDDT
jgi:hypothetical protein